MINLAQLHTRDLRFNSQYSQLTITTTWSDPASPSLRKSVQVLDFSPLCLTSPLQYTSNADVVVRSVQWSPTFLPHWPADQKKIRRKMCNRFLRSQHAQRKGAGRHGGQRGSVRILRRKCASTTSPIHVSSRSLASSGAHRRGQRLLPQLFWSGMSEARQH